MTKVVNNNHLDIDCKLIDIINSLTILTDQADESLSLHDKLNIIISESTKALAFITTIEDEFKIELDDDDIDLDFFLDIDLIKGCIYKQLSSTS